MTSRKSANTKTAKAPAPKSAAQRQRKTAVTAAQTPAQSVSPEDIARLAYSLWEERGCQSGSPEEDWFHAERELLGKRQR
jgi:hypothetical protein